MAISTYLRALGIGAVSGLRSMTGPAATLFAGQNAYAGLALVAAGGEMIVDKLPIAPPRTLPPALIVRAVLGGLSGGAVAKRLDGSRLLGMAAGAAGAVAASYAGYEIRRAIAKRGVPDALVALVEDGLAVWGGSRRQRRGVIGACDTPARP